MDASPCKITELITTADRRFVVPVFQRPYSWDKGNCAQLWDDIVDVGRRGGALHFTGSVVWVQDGTMSASGTTPLLIIDGQQRITTITLLLIALARFSKANPDRELVFSFDEIMGAGYLVNAFRKGDDYYKLMLSQGDRETLVSLIDNLVNPDVPIRQDSERLIGNLAFLQGKVASIDDPNVVWAGIRQLEVVSISLTQGMDNPQLIFESMNSTGKDLSSADLIRNFVLMGQPLDKQGDLYRTYWRPIEETLGTSTYDRVFDDFIRDYLTVIYAPEPLVKRDVYQTFKRYVFEMEYGSAKPMETLLKELRRLAGYYSAITSGVSDDKAEGRVLKRIARLDLSVVNPLLMSIYDAYDSGSFDHNELMRVLNTIESYLFRRVACDCPSNGLQKFFSPLIVRLNTARDEGRDYAEALSAMLLNEAGTARRFPTDAEFGENLENRDVYHFRRSLVLLSSLENSFHPKDERDFSNGSYTIEHIMPQNALAHDEWRAMLGDITDEEFEHLVHNLGNLTLTAYNSELSDGSFAQKKARVIGGYNSEYLKISEELHDATEWTPNSIRERARRLSSLALKVWKIPYVGEGTCRSYLPERKVAKRGRVVTFKDLFDAGLVKEGDKLVSATKAHPGSAIVTGSGAICLSNGEEFASPTGAFERLISLEGAGTISANGWVLWRLNDEGGLLLDELRSKMEATALLDAARIVSRKLV